MTNNKITLHRVFAAPVEKVFKAFTDADAMASWIPPYGFLCKVHSMDFKIGGTYKMSFTNFTTGNGHSFGGKYLEILPNELLKYSDQFDDPNLPGQMITTINLRKFYVAQNYSQHRKVYRMQYLLKCVIWVGKIRLTN